MKNSIVNVRGLTSMSAPAASAAFAAAALAIGAAVPVPARAGGSASSELVAIDGRTRTVASSAPLTTFSSKGTFATMLIMR